jgi:hypothetical protein
MLADDSKGILVGSSVQWDSLTPTSIFFSHAAVACEFNYTTLLNRVREWIVADGLSDAVDAASVRVAGINDGVLTVQFNVTTEAAWITIRTTISAGSVCAIQHPGAYAPKSCATVTPEEVSVFTCHDRNKVVTEQLGRWAGDQEWLTRPAILAGITVGAVLLTVGIIAVVTKRLANPGSGSHGRTGKVLLRLTESPFFIPSEPCPTTSAAYSPMYAEIAIDPRNPSVWSGGYDGDFPPSEPSTPRRYSADSVHTTPMSATRRGARFSMSVVRSSPMSARTRGTDSPLCEAGVSRWHSTPTNSPCVRAESAVESSSLGEDDSNDVHLM